MHDDANAISRLSFFSFSVLAAAELYKLSFVNNWLLVKRSDFPRQVFSYSQLERSLITDITTVTL